EGGRKHQGGVDIRHQIHGFPQHGCPHRTASQRPTASAFDLFKNLALTERAARLDTKPQLSFWGCQRCRLLCFRGSSRHRRAERTNSTRCALSSFISPFTLERYSEIRHGWSKRRSVERGALLGDNGDSSSVRKDAIHP